MFSNSIESILVNLYFVPSISVMFRQVVYFNFLVLFFTFFVFVALSEKLNKSSFSTVYIYSSLFILSL